MKIKRKFLLALILIVFCLLIRWYSANSLRVEYGYSGAIFPAVAKVLRTCFGWLPFSFGDLLYGLAVLYSVVKVFQFFRFVFSRRRKDRAQGKIVSVMLSALLLICWIYILFNLFWGINYNRVGIASQLKLEVKEYGLEELKTINGLLVEKVNSSKKYLVQHQISYPSNSKLFEGVSNAYENLSKQYPFLKYDRPSMKPSLWGWVGNYTGFTGYYNPFTGEAQVNTTVPKFSQPFTACHEAAHSLGYAKEQEANFVGYLAAAASEDTLFHYSVYADLLLYANRSLYFADTTAASQYRKMLSPEVIKDFRERQQFNRDHSSFMEPITRMVYGKYLQSNEQPLGLQSYDEVTAFLIAYFKKFGKI